MLQTPVHAESTLTGALSFEASCVAVGDAGVLLLGAPGCGKSDLALRLIDRGAYLVADGKVIIYRGEDELIATPPEALTGVMTPQGLPALHLPCMRDVTLRLAVFLTPEPAKAALPETFECLRCAVPLVAVNPADTSADVRIRTMVWNLNMMQEPQP